MYCNEDYQTILTISGYRFANRRLLSEAGVTLSGGLGAPQLRSVVDLLAGETKPLQIAAAGVVIALLVNRNTSEDRAIVRFASGRERDLIDQAFFAPVEGSRGFWLLRTQQPRGDPKLISGWMLYEARRRLDGCLS